MTDSKRAAAGSAGARRPLAGSGGNGGASQPKPRNIVAKPISNSKVRQKVKDERRLSRNSTLVSLCVALALFCAFSMYITLIRVFCLRNIATHRGVSKVWHARWTGYLGMLL